MTAVAPLDWRKLSLGDGRVLIEASAGTGKTWTIGAIFLRLLLERELKVEQILVVTFTDAAAQELRERLRARLADAECWLQLSIAVEKLPDDPVARWLGAEFSGAEKTPAALRRIRTARMDFDRAPIATIHALCQRIQSDFPLEAGANFAAAQRLDEDALLRECLEDFWRRRYLAAAAVDAEEADAVLDAGPAGLLRDIRDLLNHDAKVLPADGLETLRREIAALREPESIAALRELCDVGLFRSRKSAVLARLGNIVTVMESASSPAAKLAKDIDKYFDDAELDKQQPEGAALRLREQPVVHALQRLRGLLVHRKVFVRGRVLADAYDYCKAQVPLRAAQRQGQTFSMLIEAVHARVCGAGAQLADKLSVAFPAALIDEFQDTDARQFAIFDRIYRTADGASRGFLVLIGDPKQAIYGFRGGDIAAYLRAREGIAQRFDLTENFRSSKALIGACNALYGAMGDAFDDSAVRYVPVRPGGKADAKPFTRDSIAVDKPFVIHCFADAVEPRGNKEWLEQLALADCAARIVGVLNDASLRIGNEPVRPDNIAVLLPANRQIGALRVLLRARGVPCAGSGNDSVFEGDTARELQLILFAALHPGDDRAARGALCTTILGRRLVDLRAWQDDAAAFERELDCFTHWHALLRSRGAMGVVAAILDERAADLLALPDGERIVADLRQLGELLAERERTESGAEGVIAWLAAMRRDEKGMEVSSGYRLRSESDGSSVRLMTLHAAKGLEFPIVFLPLAWRIASRVGQFAPKVLRFHDADDARADLGSAQFGENLTRHFAEDLRERLRLLYVSVTRAKYAVHVYWIERNVASDAPVWNTAAIDVLLHRAQDHLHLPLGEASLPALAKQLGGIEIVEPCAVRELNYLASAQDIKRMIRAPLPELRPFLWLHSFSSITRQRVVNSLESAVADEAESPVPSETEIANAADESKHAELLALDAWRGNVFGVAVHALFENGRAIRPSAHEIEKQMTTLGVHPQGGDQKSAFMALQTMLERVCETDLGDGLRLSQLLPENCVTEFGFHLPVSAKLTTLHTVCAVHGVANVWPEHASLSALDGMLNGFADLIFMHGGRYHVLDYKTNRLGECLSDYREHAMQAAMDAHHYPLQALLYTVALHRYLQQRLPEYSPERHLGDSWYLFLRGVGLAPGAGVWRRRWPAALIEALDGAFAGAKAAA